MCSAGDDPTYYQDLREADEAIEEVERWLAEGEEPCCLGRTCPRCRPVE